jgi:uncharacterized protein
VLIWVYNCAINDLQARRMEYQFIRDPISGLRIKITSEHALIGRWLNEEIGKDKVAMVQALIASVSSSFEPLKLQGQEIDLLLTKDEALFEAHALHQDSEDLVAYQDDFLMLEENGLSSGCGFEDFVDLINSWQEFSGAK